MKIEPLVSVIIPCYNVQNYIDECLQSVYAQTYPNIEIICVDNNSTDQTLNILKRHSENGKVFVFQEFKKGASAARNMGLKKAKGKWIQFLDADDILLSNKISNQIRVVNKNEFTDVVVSPFIRKKINHKEFKVEICEDLRLGLLSSSLGITSSNIFRSSQLKKLNGWKEDLASSQEYDLMFRLIKGRCNFITYNTALTIVRDRDIGQISYSNPVKSWNQYITLRLEIIDYIKKNDPIYFKNNSIKIRQILFDSLRILIKYDMVSALKIFNDQLIGFKPKKSNSTGWVYIIIYRFFGFQRTEKIRRVFKFN